MKPKWLKIVPAANTDFSPIQDILRKQHLSTVCEEAHCPNMAECWHQTKTATFMIMGDTCTRGCKFCAIKTAKNPPALDPFEPERLARAISEIDLDYVVLTSVDRDDLPDGGASHFAQCISRIRKAHPAVFIEVLIPDFRGNLDSLKKVIDARPDVLAHNIETVERLQSKIRDPRAAYQQSLNVLATAKKLNPAIYTKSSIMLGLGETQQETKEAIDDLRNHDVDILTMGQYLKPKNRVLEVKEFIIPETFNQFKSEALDKGFLFVAAGPLVRSSYRAGELFMKNMLTQRKVMPLSHET
ncbi:MAG: lipoyl synthase [Nanoarchaeota archaeon]